MAKEDRTDPIRRGKFVLNQILCRSVNPPSPEIVAMFKPLDLNKTAREQLIASIDAAAKAQASDVAPPPVPYASVTEPIFWPASAGVGSPAVKCQKCVEGCGDMKKCAGTDDFLGGRCGAL